MHVLIKGAGVAGLTVTHELAQTGFQVTVAETALRAGLGASGYAGGMLAPFCESETAAAEVLELGQQAADWWDKTLPDHVTRNGTLVVAPARDNSELKRFATRTTGHQWLDEQAIAALEPDLAGRFSKGLYFAQEAHLDPRAALAALAAKLGTMGVQFHYGCDAQALDISRYSHVVDCTGAAAISPITASNCHDQIIAQNTVLRGVRGEMLMLASDEITLSRPVRLLHPRIPLYIVPRIAGQFMVGATMIESEDGGAISARSVMELLNAAYTLHPAFGEARVIETGAGIRPAYPDNLPRITTINNHHTVNGFYILNGFYRHGFLLAPAFARRIATMIGTQS
ncbi:glycine oxidase ThiO [Pseudochrobactrum sp. MP213Fo]|uniref:glycine oxidase ThiO n=1 Tax=Pseudochrobactrum sp. MP213Fo TaxID=3022250 RepID=UPI003BA20F6F